MNDENRAEIVPADELVPWARLEALVGPRLHELVVNPDDASWEIAERIMQADTVEAVYDQVEPTKARELFEVPLEVYGLRLHESDYEGGLKGYAAIDCANLKTGERLIVTCGGSTVLTQLIKTWLLEAFPVRIRFHRKDKPTRRGFYPYDLRFIDD